MQHEHHKLFPSQTSPMVVSSSPRLFCFLQHLSVIFFNVFYLLFLWCSFSTLSLQSSSTHYAYNSFKVAFLPYNCVDATLWHFPILIVLLMRKLAITFVLLSSWWQRGRFFCCVLPFNFEHLPTKKFSRLPLFFAFFVFDLKVQFCILACKESGWSLGCFVIKSPMKDDFFVACFLCLAFKLLPTKKVFTLPFFSLFCFWLEAECSIFISYLQGN